MLIRSIRLEGWRRFADAVSLTEFSPGLNIVHGPNGSGKSTLMMALVRALFDGHHTSGQDVESLRPWGKDLSPYVELEFEAGGAAYQLKKGFLARKQSELWKKTGASFERFKEGRGADEHLRSLLSGDEVKRGASKPQHWGLAQVLWVPQGEMKLEQLDGSARDLVQQALGAQLATLESSSVEQRICELYDTIYTSTGKLKGGASPPLVVQLEQQVREVTQRRTALLERLKIFDEASRRIEDLRQSAEQARRSEQEVMATLAGTRGKSQEYVECSSRTEILRRELQTAKAKVEEARGRLESIRAARQELELEEQRLARLQADHPLLVAAAERCELRAQEARAHAESVRARRSEIDVARRAAQDAQRLAEALRKAEQLAAQIATITQTQAEIDHLRQQRGAIVAPTKKQLAALRKAKDDVTQARLRLESSLITITLVAEEPLECRTLAGEPTGNALVEAAERVVVRGSPEAVLHVKGVGTIRASGPASSAEELRQVLSKAESQYQQLWTGFSHATLEQLEEALAESQQLESLIAQLQSRISATLGPRTLEQLQSDLKMAEVAKREICGRQAAWADAPPSSHELHTAAEQLEQVFRVDIDAAEAKVEQLRSARDAAEHQVSLSNSQTSDALGRIAQARKRLETLTSDGRDDAARQSDYQQLLLQLDLAQAKLAQAEKELAAFAADPRSEELILQKQAEAWREQVARSSEALHREEALLGQLAGEAPYSALAAVEEELVEAEAHFARERLKAEAIKLLHDTLMQVKREAVQAVIEPVKRRAQQMLQRIAGNKFESISFGEELIANGVCPANATSHSVPLTELSGGEQEQVYFAVRMALADVLFPEGRELVVLDDVFVNSDTTRIARIANLLEEASERFQIVLLTCHPERYRGLPRAKFFDLAELVRQQAPSLSIAPSTAPATEPRKPKSQPVPRPVRARLFFDNEPVESQ